jgi:PAS domain S-box-containing protein
VKRARINATQRDDNFFRANVPPRELESHSAGEDSEPHQSHQELQARLIELETRNKELQAARDEDQHDRLRRDNAELEHLVAQRTAQLQCSRNYLQTILDNLPMLAWLKDSEGRFLRVNRQFATLSGLSWNGIIGHTDLDVWPHELAEAYRADDREVMTSRSGIQREELVGTEWFETFKSPIIDATDTVIGTVGVAQNITERRNLQEKLQQSHNLLQSLTDQVPGLIYQLKLFPDGRTSIPYAGRSMQEVYGIHPEDVQEDATPLFDLIHPDDHVIMMDSIRNSAQTLNSWQLEFRVQLPAKGERWLHGYAKPQRLKDGSTLWHGYISDVTDRKHSEEEILLARNAAEAASRAKSEFLANVSHEIRTPMNAIVGLGHLMSQTVLTPQQREYLEKIDTSSHLLLDFIDSIIDLSTIEAGKLSLEQSTFSLRDTLHRTAESILIPSREKGLKLIMEVAPEIPDHLSGDTRRLEQVLRNLLGNAVKFTHQGEICVTVTPAESQSRAEMIALRFTVRDTGIGLTPEQIPQLFSPFTQGDSSTTRRYGGTGLGLSICKRLVYLMGGTIEADGMPDRGTRITFTVSFGLAPRTYEIPKHTTEAGPNGTGSHRCGQAAVTAKELRMLKGARVLVVEDQPLNQELMCEILERAGLKVECVDNGREAVSAVTDHGEALDIILMDLQMPVMDGYEATRLIREQGNTAEMLPIIAMTAHALKEEQQRCKQIGMNSHLAKPLNVDELFLCLLRHIRPTTRAGEPQPSNSPDSELPEFLPGLNLAEGIARLQCNSDLYRRLIVGFSRDRHQISEEIGEALTRGDMEQSRALAHALTGVTGNLAITGVYKVAREMDNACAAGDAERARGLLPTLKEKMAEVISSAALLEKQRSAPDMTTTSRECDAPAVLAQLKELGMLTAEHNLKSLKTVTPLIDLLVGTEYTPAAASLEEKLDNLDFGAALHQIRELIQLIETEKKGDHGQSHDPLDISVTK